MGNEQGKPGSGEGDFADPHKLVHHEQYKSKKKGSKMTEASDVNLSTMNSPPPGHQGRSAGAHIPETGVTLSEYVSNMRTYEETSPKLTAAPENSTETPAVMQSPLDPSEPPTSHHSSVPEDGGDIDAQSCKAILSPTDPKPEEEVEDTQAQSMQVPGTVVASDRVSNDTITMPCGASLEQRNNEPESAELIAEGKCSVEEVDSSTQPDTSLPDVPLESLHNEKQEAVVNIQMRHSPHVSKYDSAMAHSHSVCAQDVVTRSATGVYDDLDIDMEQKIDIEAVMHEIGDEDTSSEDASVIDRAVEATVEELCARVTLQQNLPGGNPESLVNTVHTQVAVGNCVSDSLTSSADHVDGKVNGGMGVDGHDCLSNDADQIEECVGVGELIIDKSCDVGSVDAENEHSLRDDATEVIPIPLNSCESPGTTNSVLMGNKSGGMSKGNKSSTNEETAVCSASGGTDKTPGEGQAVPGCEGVHSEPGNSQLRESEILPTAPAEAATCSLADGRATNPLEHAETTPLIILTDKDAVEEYREQVQLVSQHHEQTDSRPFGDGNAEDADLLQRVTAADAEESPTADDVPKVYGMVSKDVETAGDISDEKVVSTSGSGEDALETPIISSSAVSESVEEPNEAEESSNIEEEHNSHGSCKDINEVVDLENGIDTGEDENESLTNVHDIDLNSSFHANFDNPTVNDDISREFEHAGHDDDVGKNEDTASKVVDLPEKGAQPKDEEPLEVDCGSGPDIIIAATTQDLNDSESASIKKDQEFSDEDWFASEEEHNTETLPNLLESADDISPDSNMVQNSDSTSGHTSTDVPCILDVGENGNKCIALGENVGSEHVEDVVINVQEQTSVSNIPEEGDIAASDLDCNHNGQAVEPTSSTDAIISDMHEDEEDDESGTEGEHFEFSDEDPLDASDAEMEVTVESPTSEKVASAEPLVSITLEKGDDSTLDPCLVHAGEPTLGLGVTGLPSNEDNSSKADDNEQDASSPSCDAKVSTDSIEMMETASLEGDGSSPSPNIDSDVDDCDEHASATGANLADNNEVNDNDVKSSTDEDVEDLEKGVLKSEEERSDSNPIDKSIPPDVNGKIEDIDLAASSQDNIGNDGINSEQNVDAGIQIYTGDQVSAEDADTAQEEKSEQENTLIEIPSTLDIQEVDGSSEVADVVAVSPSAAVEMCTLEYTEADEGLRQKCLLEKGERLLKRKQQAEKEALKWKPKDVKETSANYGGLSTSISLLSRRSSDDSTSGSEMSVREIKDALAEAEEKYKQAMVQNAQLDNERQQLSYMVDRLKDSLEEQEDQLYRIKKEYKDKCQELERDKRLHEALQKKYADLQEALRQRDELIQTLMARDSQEDSLKKAICDLEETLIWKDKKIEALARHLDQYKQSEKENCQQEEQGLVMVGSNGVVGEDSDEEDQPEGSRQYALVTREAAQVLVSAGEGSLDVRLKHLAEEKQTLYDQVQRLKAELEEERRNSENLANNQPSNYTENGVADMQLLEVQREASKQISEYKFKLQKAEQEIGSYQANVSRLEAHLQRYKATSEVLEKSEDEMRAEKRKLQRDLRAALDRIEEMEMTNAHLEKRLERMKANRSAQANQT